MSHEPPEATLTKSGREIMEILEAYDLTGCAWSAAELAGCGPETIARYLHCATEAPPVRGCTAPGW